MRSALARNTQTVPLILTKQKVIKIYKLGYRYVKNRLHNARDKIYTLLEHQQFKRISITHCMTASFVRYRSAETTVDSLPGVSSQYLDEVSFVSGSGSASAKCGTFGLSGLDEAEDLLELLLVHLRALQSHPIATRGNGSTMLRHKTW